MAPGAHGLTATTQKSVAPDAKVSAESEARQRVYLEQTLRTIDPARVKRYRFVRPNPDANWQAWQQRTGELPPDFSQMESIYELPEPLLLNGKPVTTPEQWMQKREWIKEQFERWIGGHAPPAPENILHTVLEERRENDVLVQTIELRFGPENGAKMTIELMIPPGAGTKPVYLTQWNHRNWAQVALRRGYIACRYAAADDNDDTVNYPDLYPEYDFTGLMRRAWGASRVIDYLTTRPEVDGKQIAIAGHSRNGKQSLWAAAFDERIAASVISSCGTGGMLPFRFTDPQYCNATIDDTMGNDWLLPRMRYFFGREHKLPIDQNLLTALVAPRALLMHYSYVEMQLNPWAYEKCYESVAKVYSLLGAEKRLGHRSRMGEHAVATRDVELAIDFLDMQFGRRKFDWVNNRFFDQSFEKWRSLAGQTFSPDAIAPVHLARHTTVDAFEAQQQTIRTTLGKLLGEKPAGVDSIAIAPSHPQRIDWIEGVVQRPEVKRAKSLYFGPYTAPRDHLGVHLYYPENADLKAAGTKLPVIIYLHPYAYNTGFSAGHRAYQANLTAGLFQDFIDAGFAVMAFDMIGFGTRVEEGAHFYERYPRWSKMGKMVDDVRACVDAAARVPYLDEKKIFLVGSTIGGNVALLTAALDERVAGVAVSAAFTPWRDGSFPPAIKTIADEHCFLPQLGFWENKRQDVPVDYPEIISCIAPRPAFIIAPTLDWHANHASVQQSMKQVAEVYSLYGQSANLQFDSPEELNRISKKMQKDMMRQLTKWSGAVAPGPQKSARRKEG